MHNTQLYIENTLIELDNAVHFAITKTFEDITNPTVIINDWSKSIDIPGTQANNQFFGHIYNPDMQITNSSSGTYINFDPTRKLDMKIIYDGQLLMSGFAKIIEIKRKDGKIYYNCTLSGQMGKIFQEFNKIRFDQITDTSTTADLNYVIDTSRFFIEVMDCSHMNNLWMTNQQVTSVFDASDNINPALKASDIINFTPNNAFNDDFDYTTYQVTKNKAEKFTTRLEYGQPSLTTQIPADTIYPNGLKPRDIGEFRTYNQLPFMYFNKLFQIVGQKCYSLTGYRFKLDESWFHINNPYWYKLVLMLQPLQYTNEQLKEIMTSNVYNSTAVTNSMSGQDYTQIVDTSAFVQGTFGYTEDVQLANWTQPNQRAYWFNTTAKTYPVNLPLNLYLTNYGVSEVDENLYFYDNTGLVVEVEHLGDDGQVKSVNRTLVCSDKTSLNTSSYDNVVYASEFYQWSGNQYRISFTVSDIFTVDPAIFGTKFGVGIKTYWILNSRSSAFYYKSSRRQHDYFSDYPIYVTGTGPMSIRFINEIRSGASYTLSNLWNFEYTPWQIILNYCKMFRLLISVDETLHAISFIPAIKYFETYSIEDWTKKLDVGRDFAIKPVYWEAQNVLFNVDNSETQIGKIYNEKYGINYGEKKIITDYKFDNNTTKLFEGLKTCLATTENVLSWTTTYDIGMITYTRPSTEILIHSHDDDNKLVNPFGSFAFASGNSMWNSPNGNLRYVCISDDTVNQKSQSTYYYTQSSDPSCYILSNGYQKVDVTLTRNLCLFGKPSENYSTSSWNGRNDIYYCFWEKYINERYNIQSKLVTCYLDIKPLDFLKFKFNKFIRIENQLYFVNKIYDYDIMSSTPTKCDLITIRNIEAYTTDNYEYLDGNIKKRTQTIHAGDTVDFEVSCNGNGTWIIESPGVMDVVPNSGTGNGQGTITISQNAEPRTYNIMIYRSDSPFTHLADIEHVNLSITVEAPES